MTAPENKMMCMSPDTFASVQFSGSVMSDSLWPHESQHVKPPCPSPTPGVHSNISIESVMPSSYLILCCPVFLLPPIPPSIRVFSNESTLHMRWPKYWCFSFSIIPSKHPGLISFRMDWLDLLAVQGALKSLFQHQTVTTVFINYLTRVLDTLPSTLPKNGILSLLHHRLKCNLSAFRTLCFFVF